MSKSVLDAKALHDEAAAYRWVEARLWPNGPVCPHCSATDRISKMQGESTRIGAYKCYHCRKKFTVKVGTVFEASHVPMHLWLQAVYLMCSSKKGVSSHQLHRTLGVTVKTAWFMSHRLREAMRVLNPGPMGGEGAIVEADETFIGRKQGVPKHQGYAHKNAVLTLVERGMIGVYQHCKEKHLHRYLAEFDFRYSNRVRLGVDDVERTERALKGVVGKRLTYRTSGLHRPEAD